ncbi:hypothetical protein [Trueperella pyogenes]|uniref:hypothetical protein n=1 Tax=Trueperella pyogenes TaxID=1661 RepID=UPI003CC90A59
MAESSPSIVTPLNRHIGYENAAKIAKHSVKENITVKKPRSISVSSSGARSMRRR